MRGPWSPVPGPWSAAARDARGGFALLITVTLLAFIVVLLVGLAAFTRIETAAAGNTQRQAQARENALLGLNLALGQLQKHAGPDQRVTATAEAFKNAAATRHYTGVWRTDKPDADTGGPTLVTWFVSGNEVFKTPGDASTNNPLAVTPATAINTTNGAVVVSTNTSGVANDVLAPLVPISASGIPGQSGSTTIGRYAWWVGDNGVKADVARTDVAARASYAPFSEITEARARMFQQTGLGAGPFNTADSSTPFEPRDAANLALAANVVTPQQLAFLRSSSGGNLGIAGVRPRYHQWTAGNHAVLARANAPAGQPALRNDLSLNPGALGPAFAAWTDYPGYMETPAAAAVKRRYKMTPPVTSSNGAQFSVAPVLSYVALAFSLRNNARTAAALDHLECAVRGVVGLWNPYTGALVPEAAGLQIFVTGLPTIHVQDTRGADILVDLQKKLGDSAAGDSPFKLLLPWQASGQGDDHDSWLPGRVYNWSLVSSNLPPPDDGAPMDFAVRNLAPIGGGRLFNVGPPLALSTSSSPSSPDHVDRFVRLDTPVTLKFELRRLSDGATLATFTSPPFNAFPTTVRTEVDNKLLDFAFVFRLADPDVDGAAWLQTAGTDPRVASLPASAYTLPGNAADPAAVVVDTSGELGTNLPGGVGNPSLLLDRYPGVSGAPAGTSFDEDVPVFEFPRAPLVSLGELQHLALPSQRPFWIGSSLAAAGPEEWNNGLFDRHFFSGLGSGSAWSDLSQPLPNPLLWPLRRRPDGSVVKSDDFAAGALSAKFLLQGGAFNVNSTDANAWAAVLRSVRFTTDREFKYIDAAAATGTGDDGSLATLTAAGAFLRFSQSAQETFKTTPDYAQSDSLTSASRTVVHTDYYRRGLRTLDAATIGALAQNIAAAVRARLAARGPFLSIEEFLNPAAGAGTPSLLEQAILDLKLNQNPNDPAGGSYPFSSVYLTQADIMTALAPVLFARSDTFTVRAYGEAVNPATNATEGRAWCEAIVQRFPEPFAPAAASQPSDDEYKSPPGDFGRRFKIVSFRWLAKSDI